MWQLKYDKAIDEYYLECPNNCMLFVWVPGDGCPYCGIQGYEVISLPEALLTQFKLVCGN